MTSSRSGDDAYRPWIVDPWEENWQYAPTRGILSRTYASDNNYKCDPHIDIYI